MSNVVGYVNSEQQPRKAAMVPTQTEEGAKKVDACYMHMLHNHLTMIVNFKTLCRNEKNLVHKRIQ